MIEKLKKIANYIICYDINDRIGAKRFKPDVSVTEGNEIVEKLNEIIDTINRLEKEVKKNSDYYII